MSRHNGRPIPMPMPMPQAQPMVLAQPINDVQCVGLMAAALLSRDVDAAPLTPEEFSKRADQATGRAIDLLCHAQYKMARGILGSALANATAQGQAHAKAAAEAEEAKARGEGEPPTSPGGIIL